MKDDGSQAAYVGEYEGETYTVVVIPTETLGAPRGKRRVVLRTRYRGRTEDFVELVSRTFTERSVHTLVRRLIAQEWHS